ncbi:hypothetical protein HK097_009017 [Rhizophlyctis rosea]|uniref:Uncharacterized protein n=1 Tax=Rhizophlyctis rosea TaxID=64517 RepID=A0AAD5S9N1_9FUNG|nr:hypothetical protein HK097_009017 [Rhizophlyctis rosea]
MSFTTTLITLALTFSAVVSAAPRIPPAPVLPTHGKNAIVIIFLEDPTDDEVSAYAKKHTDDIGKSFPQKNHEKPELSKRVCQICNPGAGCYIVWEWNC